MLRTVPQAYLLFTLDKLIAAFVKQVRGFLYTLQRGCSADSDGAGAKRAI